MEPIDEIEYKENVEKILRDFECNESIYIDKVKCVPGCKDGDNYMSVVKRIIISGKFNENEDYRRSLIIKRQIPNLTRRQLFRADVAFANEIQAYAFVVPCLRQITNNNIALPMCLYAGADASGDIIALEDLAPSGHQMADRLKGLDYGHCKIVMQELGVLHGTSRAMKVIDPLGFHSAKGHLNEVVYCMSAIDFYTHSLESSLKEALFSLRQSNKHGELDGPIQKIDRMRGKLFKIMFKCVVDVEEPWAVLCHGDLWINNLLFKYNKSNVCEGVKLVDLQTMRYSSPVIDILHFLYTSTEYKLREKYMDQLLLDYTVSLLKTMQRLTGHYGTDPKVFNLELDGIRRQMQEKALYGLGICMWLMPAVTFHPDKIPDLDAVSLSDFENSNQADAMTQMQTPEYHTRMKETVMEFMNRGYLNNIAYA